MVYDSFGLRVVFERDKTGFEESKDTQRGRAGDLDFISLRGFVLVV